MTNEQRSSQRKLKAACDQCHAAKVKCRGQRPHCSRCIDISLPCHYSFAARMGKPPGSKNRKTLERMLAPEQSQPMQQQQPQQQQQQSFFVPPSSHTINNDFLDNFGPDDFSGSPQTPSEFSLTQGDNFMMLDQCQGDKNSDGLDEMNFESENETNTSPAPAISFPILGMNDITVRGPKPSRDTTHEYS